MPHRDRVGRTADPGERDCLGRSSAVPDGRPDRGPARERLILVDSSDRPLGTEEKLRAHRRGLLHRAFSVFVFDGDGGLLMQRRAWRKYHSGGLWSNTCCGHPRPGEAVAQAAHRRLREEMGFDCPLRRAFGFVYRAELDNGLVEHEYDHVFIGRWDGVPVPNEHEVAGWRSREIAQLRADIANRPHEYTYWFRLVLNRVVQELGRTADAPADG